MCFIVNRLGSCGLYFKWPFSIRDKESNWEFVRAAGHLRSTIEIPQATSRLYSTPTTAEAALDCERLRKHICWWLKCGVLRWPLDHNVIVKALRVSYLATTRALSIKLRFLSFAKPKWLINVSRVITFCFVCCFFFLYLLLANFKVNCLQHISFQIVCICICLKNKYSCPSGLFFNSSLRRKMLRSLCFKPVDLFT